MYNIILDVPDSPRGAATRFPVPLGSLLLLLLREISDSRVNRRDTFTRICGVRLGSGELYNGQETSGTVGTLNTSVRSE